MQGAPDKGRPIKLIHVMAWLFVALGFASALYGVTVIAADPRKFELGNLANLGGFLQGSTASLWALAGLLFIFDTVRTTNKQLEYQEKQLEQQEKESLEQLKSIQLQSFENTFFQLLGMLNNITNGLEIHEEREAAPPAEGNRITYHGRDCFTYWHSGLRAGYRSAAGQIPPAGTGELPAPTRAFLENHYQQNQTVFGHYFRMLYQLIKFVDESKVVTDPLEKRRYIHLVRAQLSAHELVFLFYNGLIEKKEKLKTKIKAYNLLKHLDPTLLLNPAHAQLYQGK